MNKYLLTAHKYTYLKRGAHLTSNRLVDQFPENLDYKVDLDAQDLEKLNNQYKRIIFITQQFQNYHFKLDISRLKKLNYIIMLRSNQNPILYNSGSNGFHYYKTYKNIKFYVPFVTDFPMIEKVKHGIPCLGFYIRRNVTPDSLVYINDFLKNLKQSVDIFVMGNPTPEFLKYDCINSYTHTYDHIKFFSNISHYIYPTSKQFQDPFPNSILEAVQTGAQIVFPEIPNRTHKDGIDDIKDCIKWHKDFNPYIEYDNSNCILKAKNFKNFYLNLFENNFEYSFDRTKYSRFNEWIEGEVL